MKVLTSLGFNRIERQQLCLASWRAVGCSITSVQSVGEAGLLKPHFPDVTFVETDLVGNKFGKPKLVRISALLNQVGRSNALILNSDIEVRTPEAVFKERWTASTFDEIKLGIRWDHYPDTGELKMLEWGIDAFLITPNIVRRLEDIGMTMGCPAWDYWIPLILHNKFNFKITTHKQPELIHEYHPKNWSDKDYSIGVKLLKEALGISPREASLQIRKLTNR